MTAAEAWLMAGGPHHTALTSSLGTEPLLDFADMANLELVEIDADTRTAAFKRELRWNNAYYFIDRGV
jgi:L-arabinose isomerase